MLVCDSAAGIERERVTLRAWGRKGLLGPFLEEAAVGVRRLPKSIFNFFFSKIVSILFDTVFVFFSRTLCGIGMEDVGCFIFVFAF